MKHRQFLLCCGLLAGIAVNAQTDSLVQELSILADRFFLHFPKEARNEAREVNIMSAPPGEEEETRIVLDRGDERVVFYARELNMLAPKDLAGVWEEAIEGGDPDAFAIGPEVKKGACGTVVYSPRALKATGEATLISGLAIRCADDMLLTIQAYADSEAFAHIGAYQKLVADVFGSFRAGSRVIDLSERTVRYPFYFSDSLDLVIDLPAGHVINTDDAYDFFVYRVRKLAYLGANEQTTLILYLGHHPSLVMGDLGLGEQDASRRPGTLFGRPMEWLVVDDDAKGTHLREQIVPMSEHGALVSHTAAFGSKAKEVDALVDLAQRIRIEPHQ